MSVNQDPSGRRSVELEFELPGTPEDVWQAIATGPGISSWFVPTEIEERDGKPIAIKLNLGPGMESRALLTAWDPPQKLATQSESWMPGAPSIANEWSIESRGGNTCILRIVQSLFASTDDWDNQLEAARGGLSGYLRTLRIYLTHFRGQRSAAMKWMAPFAGTEAEAWEVLTAAVGLKDVRVGERWTSPAGVPALSGVVEYFTHDPNDALVRLDKPGPGVAALGTFTMGGPSIVALAFYLYGDQAAENVARESPRWEAWFQQRFPAEAVVADGK